MNDIEFVHLETIKEDDIIDLMNNPAVRKYLPLMTSSFSHEMCQHFLKAKKALWNQHGFGPWAFIIEGNFAGWGGLQPENGDADFALILHPNYWGWGRKTFNHIVDQAFHHMQLDSITALLPPDRPNLKAITRLGFIEDGSSTIDGTTFIKFRLTPSS